MGMMAWPLPAVGLANHMGLSLQQVRPWLYQIHMFLCHQADCSWPCALTGVWKPDAGDTVGALLNRTSKTISFIKNGLDLGVAFNNVNETLLYPSVGLRTPGEEVCEAFLACSM